MNILTAMKTSSLFVCFSDSMNVSYFVDSTPRPNLTPTRFFLNIRSSKF